MLKPLALLLALAGPAVAEDFETALDMWLAGEDMAALESFRTLAEAGDVDAQLFLGQIATQAAHWPPEVSALPRRERNALLRAPGGLSGKSWTAVAAETDARAAAFDGATRPIGKGQALLALLEMGEVATVEAAWPGYISSGDWTGALAVATHPQAGARLAAAAPGLRQLIENEIANVDLDARRTDLYPPDAAADPDRMVSEGARLADLPEVAPFVTFCRSACGETEIPACVGAIFASATTDPVQLARSPVAGLLAPERYSGSPRAMADAARAIDLTKYLWDQTEEPAIARLSSCAWAGAQASSSASQ
ncbi:hypothetical protein [Jannaschia marina]|uniref:hypothetical protein n=1 Tax=Jannaschia marina TaxID=2741674 RepID=UPI0015CC69B0|nr:hypothetical protein [Jannaschia marina]